ncbi:CheR family methyltransferase [Cellulomonas bogoriensis]|uniref:protein-glutamate O-methyltransferase n=1 Tax=Cellulomonas bogoriensis 69B4 = DSM 16987 TaxID=1386082 RepID=A0A0A0C3A7_9CELL|nr:protein-glutamate O-methyltransferase CheR [Cellulomonas bogoriensis]KGM13834.1 chemotaxis protein CheR [Cellulomonas bogoriensis 69B4 = DSM 16987]
MTLTADTFTYVADLVRTRSAIQLDTGKEYLVESRLLPMARAAGVPDVDTFVRALRATAAPKQIEAVVEALTTNETSWFRDAQPFRALTEHIVPAILGSSSGAFAPSLRIWSAACSSGQEPYSIAMSLEDLLPPNGWRITATDLNEQMLTRARAGRYNQLEMNRGLPVTMLVKHFSRAGTDWEVNPQLRRTISFVRHNLLDPPPTGGPFDVVFLRNVLIYFDLATKRDVLQRVHGVLKPGGYLILGAAETTIGIDDGWERVPVGAGSAYRRTARRAA